MDWDLSRDELRVLGSLIEKSLATPDHYPLTVNALTAACNQRSNRDPVMNLSEADVRKALLEINYTGWAAAEVRGGDADRLAEISANMDKVFAS